MRKTFVAVTFVLLAATATVVSAQERGMSLEDRAPRPVQPPTAAAQDVNVTCTIRNGSSGLITSANIAIKDEDTQAVRECVFGNIPSRQTRTVSISMPGGIETALYRVNFQGGDFRIGAGACDDCRAVNLTISD